MRLGWYARLVIVAMGVYTVVAGFRALDTAEEAKSKLRANWRDVCLEYEGRGERYLDRSPDETCFEWAFEQTAYFSQWDAWGRHFVGAGIAALFYGVLALLAFWLFRWIWAGRKAS